jgi:prepilin-type N-terminal cleavage/methylation domain-containing protein
MKSRRAFSLLELLIAIAIIAVLAGLVISVAKSVLSGAKKREIEGFLAELASGLEEYRVDHGIYPLNPDGTGGGIGSPGTDVEAVRGAFVLYRHLSGDFDLDGQIDADGEAYVDGLDFWSNSGNATVSRATRRSSSLSGGYAVIDPLGSPVRYIAAPLGVTTEHQYIRDELKQRNPTYDLWSIAGTDPVSPDFSDQANWVTNW